jgi:molecular chaperone DnaK (HSP70)
VSDVQEVDVMIPEDFASNSTDSYVTVEVTVEEFEELTTEYLDTTMTLTNNVLNELITIRNKQAQNGKPMQKLDEILLVGGSTRMPQVSKALKSNIKLQSLMDEIVITVHDPDEAVASGAALWAELMGTIDESQVVRPTHVNSTDESAIPQSATRLERPTVDKTQNQNRSPRNSEAIPVVVEEKLHKSYGVVVRDDDGVTESLSNIIYKDTAYNPKIGVSHVKSYRTIAHAQKQIRVRIIENIATANDPETIELSKAISQYEAKQIFDFDFDLPEGTPKDTSLFIQFFFDPSAILRISVAEQFKGTKMENQQVEIGGVVTDIAALKMRQRLEELTRND